jgi:hypothetical protein
MFRFNQLLEAAPAITPLLGSGFFFFEIVCSDQIEKGRFTGGRNGRKEGEVWVGNDTADDGQWHTASASSSWKYNRGVWQTTQVLA